MEADYVLTVMFRETHETTGRAIGGALAGMYTYWKQVGVACILDMRDSRMVACNAKVDHWGNLRVEANAERATNELLMELLMPHGWSVATSPPTPE